MEDINQEFGKKYDHLLVIDVVGKGRGKSKFVKCKCDCGQIIEKSLAVLKKNQTNSCKLPGCQFSNLPEHEIGNKYGHLTVIEYVGKDSRRNRLYKCQCDCGNIIERSIHNLKRNLKNNAHCNSSSCEYNHRSKQIVKKQRRKWIGNDPIVIQTQSISIIQQEKDQNEEPDVHIGMEFGLLKVVSKHSDGVYTCNCSCGRQANIKLDDLLSKKRVSCMNEFCKHNPKGFSKYARQAEIIANY